MAETPMMEAALWYATHGWAVFPVEPRGKRPATAHGLKDATTDAETVRRWWTSRPECNVGAAMGSVSGGVIAIDLDVHGADGLATLREWEAANGELPETARSVTGSGGEHLFFRAVPAADAPRNSANGELGVDVRGEGGYVVLPPSVNAEGRAYVWDVGPDEAEPAEADARVAAFLGAVRPGKSAGDGAARLEMPEKQSEGGRNDLIFRFASSQRSSNVPEAAALAGAEAYNTTCCIPPLDESEIEKIVHGVYARYPAGHSGEQPGRRGGLASRTQAGRGGLVERTGVGLTMELSRDGTERPWQPEQSIANVQRVLEQDPLLSGRVFLDVRASREMIVPPIPWDSADDGEPRNVIDNDYIELAAYIQDNYKLRSKEQARDGLRSVARRHPRNLVVEWLESLEWDGRPRIATLLGDYLGVADDEYTAGVMRLFMLEAIERAYRPGAKCDYVPVLVGPQGSGKSKFCALLAHREEWFCDNFNTVDPVRGPEKMAGLWIAELSELLAMKDASSVNAVKSFITSTTDVYRRPYATDSEHFRRGCVFIGTTNDTAFLTDRTGNRRWLPIDCFVREPTRDIDAVDAPEWIGQAWAEAMHVRDSEHPKLWLTGDAAETAAEMQERYAEDDTLEGIVLSWLDDLARDWDGADSTRPTVCARQIVVEAVPEDMRSSNTTSQQKLVNRIHEIIRRRAPEWVEGAKPKKKRIRGTHGEDYKLQKYYEYRGEPTAAPRRNADAAGGPSYEPGDEELPF